MSKEGLKRGVVCAAVALAASLALWGRAAQTQGQQQGDKPVEQTRKNIQVLKGLPESQLFPEMNFIASSLGVQCGFCHVSQGKDAQGRTNWVWESDEKEEKKTARDMMRMVLAVSGDKYAAAVGAPDALAKFQTMTLKGTMTASQGRTQAYELTIKGADRFLLVTE